MENFDGIGRYRTEEFGGIIEPAGQLDGVEFDDAVGLSEAIRNHEDFVPCVVKMLSRYATGRIETRTERAWIDVLTQRFQRHDHQLKPLILELVMSPLFTGVGSLKEAE